MPHYCVSYEQTNHYDIVVEATNEMDAIHKAEKIIDDANPSTLSNYAVGDSEINLSNVEDITHQFVEQQ